MTIDQLTSNFELLGDWEDRYSYLIDLGRKLPGLPEADKVEENRVHGCQASVWLKLARDSNNGGRVRIQADSNAAIVRGLVAVLVLLFDHKTAAEIVAVDAKSILGKLRLDQHLSPTRKNGLFAMVERIRRESAQLQPEMAGMNDDLSELYQQVILDHSKSPRNYRVLPPPVATAQGRNPICGDNYTVFLKLNGEVIEDIGFQGSGCAISKSSASVMTDAVKGKTKDEARALFDKFHEVIVSGRMDLEGAGKLAAFAGVHKFPARVKCAILSWHAMKAALVGEREVSTEKDER